MSRAGRSWHVRRAALVLGALGVLACVLGAVRDPQGIWSAWLVSWLFFLNLSLGSLAILMVHELTGGAWGMTVRRFFEAAVSALPALAVLFVPLAVAAPQWIPWAEQPGTISSGLALPKTWYLDLPFFIARAILYFACWIALALLLAWRSPRSHPRVVSAAGLIVYFLTVTAAAVDWVGSLEPRWSSSALGLIVIVGQGVAAFSAAICWVTAFARTPARESDVTADHLNDLGNLLLAFVMTWGYLAFVQYLIIWAEDLPRETSWYLERLRSSWRIEAWVLLALELALPLGALLFRGVKRNARWLGVVAWFVLVGAWLDAHWLVAPTLSPHAPGIHWLNVPALLGIGGLWGFAALTRWASRSPPGHAGVEPAR